MMSDKERRQKDAARKRAKRASDPEGSRAYDRNFYHENKSKIRKVRRVHRDANRAKVNSNKRRLYNSDLDKNRRIQRERNFRDGGVIKRNKQKEYRARHPDRVLEARRKYKITKPVHVMLTAAKGRARALELPFNLTPSDLSIPKLCPVLGIKLVLNTGHIKDDSPTLDRIDVRFGYVRGNVAVISRKANRLKSNGSLEDFEAIVEYMKNHLPR